LPRQICNELPDPSPTAPNPLTPGVLDAGCPGPGIYEGAANDVTVPAGTCVLKPGVYVFDNADLDVSVGASIASYLTTDTSGGFPVGTGVTLVFYGKGTLTVEGHIGILDPADPTRRDPLIASLPSLAPPPDKSLPRNQPIPGVALVFDQFNEAPASRTFTLGDDFDITGTLYALDGYTTWATNPGDCEASSTCAANVYPDGTPSWIEVTKTAFADDGRVPTVAPLAPQAGSGPTTTSSPRAVLIQ
jgi:hypothetical protein